MQDLYQPKVNRCVNVRLRKTRQNDPDLNFILMSTYMGYICWYGMLVNPNLCARAQLADAISLRRSYNVAVDLTLKKLQWLT